MTATETVLDAVPDCGAVRSRRRGAALEEAIHESVFAELAAVGYGGLTIESVAARAHTGKASIYRRWPTKQALVAEAFVAKYRDSSGPLEELGSSRLSTRDLLVELGRRIVELCTECGEVFRAVAGEVDRYPELAAVIEENVHAPKRALLVAMLQRGADRGEVRPEAVCELYAEVLPAALMYELILMNRPVSDERIERVVDGVVMPLIRTD